MGWLTTGPKVDQFEADFAAYKGIQRERVAAVSSCTAALHLSLIAAGIGQGDEVITTPVTFCATVNAIMHAGATPVLADVDPVTMNVDPGQVEASIGPRTRAIIVVHLAGRPCEMDALLDIAARHGLVLVEDCAHAIETEYKGVKAGTMGDFGCFSFYATKNVTTGEGGMVIARDEQAIARVKRLSLHGMSKDAWGRFGRGIYRHYTVVECGFKYNLSDLLAAVGIHQLARVEQNWLRRRRIWEHYQCSFADLPVTCPVPPDPDNRHAYHLYTLLIDQQRCGVERDQFLVSIAEANIGVGVHYLSLPEHAFYQRTFGWLPESYPQAMRIGRQVVSLPLSARMTDKDMEDVVNGVKKVLGQGVVG
jgi:dTDP-4-amino-4,6-dideoxygalactose transaminase